MDSNPYQSPDNDLNQVKRGKHTPSRAEWVWMLGLAGATVLAIGIMLLYASVTGYRPLP